MKQKITGLSTIEFGFNEMTLIVRRPWGPVLFSLGISAAILGFFWYNEEHEIFDTSHFKNNYWVLLFPVLVVSIQIYDLLKFLFYRESYKMDLTNRTLQKENTLFSFVLKTVEKDWNSDAYFKYENVYDSYQRITSIWLVVSSKEKSESKRLIRFFDKETFLKFRHLFNEHFPAHKILEWHD